MLTHRMLALYVRRALNWLDDKGEARRYAAALIQHKLAKYAPKLFTVHMF